MRLPEQRLWDAMRKAAPRGLWLERVENIVGEGIPDVHVGGARWDWVELKAPNRPKRETTPLMGAKEGLRQQQINWHVKAESMNLPSWILIRDTDKKELFLVSNKWADMINDMSVGDLRDVRTAATWEEIFMEIGR